MIVGYTDKQLHYYVKVLYIVIEEVLGVDEKALRSSCRFREIVDARKIFIVITLLETAIPLRRIAPFIELKTPVIYIHKREYLEDGYKFNPILKRKLELVRTIFCKVLNNIKKNNHELF